MASKKPKLDVKMVNFPKFKPEKVLNAKNVFRRIGMKAMHKDFLEEAINIFNLAESVTKYDDEKVDLCVYKSKAQRALANMDDSRYEALKAMAYDSKDGVVPYLNMANLLYHENEFEDSMTKLSKGLHHRNPDFRKGIDLVKGTLAKSVGTGAGRMFDNEILGNVVLKMRQESKGIMAPQQKLLSYSQEIKREASLKQRKQYLAGKFLGKMALEKFYFNDLANTELVLSNPDVDFTFRDIIEDTLEKLELKEKALWCRQPLYYFYNKIRSFASSDRSKAYEEQKRQYARTILQTQAINKVKEIYNLRLKRQYSICFLKFLLFKKYLEYIPKAELPIKDECKFTINTIIAEMYLSTKYIVPKISQEMNDLRIKCYLGVHGDYWPPKIEDVYHVKVRNLKGLLSRLLDELDRATDENERAFLNCELACLMALKTGKGKESRHYAFNALISSKKANHELWFLNSLFVIARSAFTDDRFEEGVLTLVAAKIACEKYGKNRAAEFINRALLLLQHLGPEDFKKKKSILGKEKRLTKSMPNVELKDKAASFFITLCELPLWRRMQLPGSGTYKQRQKALRELRPYPVEKMPEHEYLPVSTDNWISNFDDTKPYFVKDIMSVEDKQQQIEKVNTTKHYMQFLSATGRARDYLRRKQEQNLF